MQGIGRVFRNGSKWCATGGEGCPLCLRSEVGFVELYCNVTL